MKAKTCISILIVALAVLIIDGTCATTRQTQEEKEGVSQEDLFESVKCGDYAEVKRLIRQGAAINAQNNDGWTALILALDKENPEIAKLLIDAGADVNIQDNEGWTALLWASAYRHPEIAELLRESGAKE